MLADLLTVAVTGTLGSALLPAAAAAEAGVTALLVGGLVVLLGVALAIGRCWHPVLVCSGGLEYTRVLQAGTGALLVLALSEVALHDYRLRPYTLFVLPAAVLAVLAEGQVRVTPIDGAPIAVDAADGFLSVDHDRVEIVARHAQLA